MKFEKTKLSQAVYTAVVASSLAGGQAMAQDTQAMEEVYVEGIRGSLDRAMDVKRDASGVVDAISAEDIGKFPDSNLAESLQRITGVSIDRRNGEGSEITVRGFGPSFNLVLLNGRTMPTSGLNLSKSGGSGAQSDRSFDMSNLAAEGVSGVEVYKTAKSDLPSGGIGATVNLQTRRPFDQDGFTATVGAKALSDSTNRIGDDVTPELSTFVSWSNEIFGASLAYTTQERHSARTGVFTNSWSGYSGGWTDATFIEGVDSIPGTDDPATQPCIVANAADCPPGRLAHEVNVLNAPTPADDPSTPNVNEGQQTNLTPGIRYFHEDRERERENMQLTFQFSPIDNLTATLDYTEATQDIFLNGAELSFWFGGGSFPATDVQFDQHPQVRSPVYFWAENPQGYPNNLVRDIGITQNQGNVTNELESTGLNVEFQATDELSFVFDHHSSDSSSLPGSDDIGSYFNIAMGAQGVWAQGYDNSGDLPLLVGNFALDNRPGGTSPGFPPGGNDPDALDVGDLGSTVRQGWHSRTWSEIDQTRLDGSWEFSDRGSIDFGVESRTMEATQRSSFLQEVLEGNWGVSQPGDIPPEMMSELNYASLFDGYSTALGSDAQDFFNQAGIDDGTPSGAQGEVFTTGFIADDVGALGEVLSERAGLAWEPNPNDGTNRTIEEEITAFYVQGTYNFDMGSMPAEILAGVRYEDTEVTSIGQVAAAEILWQGDNDLITQQGSAADAPVQVGKGEYTHTLPSLALSVNFRDDLIGRFAYSKTISRPNYGNMLEGINNVQPPNGGPTVAPFNSQPGVANNGNPDLNPLESDNFDLSVEWYYAESSYASIGYFLKDVPNFVGTGVEERTVPTTLDPTAGPRAQAAVQALEDQGEAVNQQNLFAMVASMGGPGCITQDDDGAACGDDFGAWTYEGATGWEDNVDLVAVEDGPNADPQYTARVNFPVDNRSAELDGWELAIQHFFGETGFGLQANYTIVDGDVSFDIDGDPLVTQFALTGLSDSANLVAIYEKHDWSARLAYNWRDEFLVNPADAANEPRHTEEYEQVDLNVSYNITDQWSASFEAINLTAEDQRDFARTKRQLLRLDILDTRYALGVRYEF